MRIVFQNLNPSPERLSAEDLAVLTAAELVVAEGSDLTPFFVTSIESSPFVAELNTRGWNYELVADNAQYVSQAEIDALVSRTWSRAKKKYDFDRSLVAPPVVEKTSGSQVRAAQRKLARIESSREYRVGTALLRPLRAVRNIGSSKAKS